MGSSPVVGSSYNMISGLGSTFWPTPAVYAYHRKVLSASYRLLSLVLHFPKLLLSTSPFFFGIERCCFSAEIEDFPLLTWNHTRQRFGKRKPIFLRVFNELLFRELSYIFSKNSKRAIVTIKQSYDTFMSTDLPVPDFPRITRFSPL